MGTELSHLSIEQKLNAIQRLTALWAFAECGLGGVMHALQIPFTGLLVGGVAVIMISLIAALAGQDYRRILKSAMVVLIVKAMVSPHTPFPAYIAVSFQALLGYGLFRLLRVNFFSIILLSSLAMIESAIQKILVLTVFFGESIWKAMDSMIALLAKQFGGNVEHGSYWIVGIYAAFYLLGGIMIALLANKTINSFKEQSYFLIPGLPGEVYEQNKKSIIPAPKNNYKKLWVLAGLMLFISAVLFVFADSNRQGWLEVVKTISWTLSAILIWYMLIGPVLTKAIQKILHKKESRYSDEVLSTLSFLPVLKQLTTLAWQQSKMQKGYKRWYVFFAVLVQSTLTYSEASTNQPVV